MQITAAHAWDAAYRSPRITVELNDGVGAHERVNPQARGPRDARACHRRDQGAPAGAYPISARTASSSRTCSNATSPRPSRTPCTSETWRAALDWQVGTSADNAMAESVNASLKREPLAGAHGWPDADHAHREVFAWIVRYNTRRPPSTCAYLSPADDENAHHTTTLALAA